MARPDPHIAPGAVERPELTLPPAEADWVTELYGVAGTILEYGSGGTTVLASEMPGKTVFSVENDADWAAMMQGYFDAHPPEADVHLHHVDTGRTRAWGMPAGHGGWRRYHRYPITVWDREDFLHPDVVLIDGRFRLACLMTVQLRITRPVSVLFDDYKGRKPYRDVEAFASPAEMRGRMARFELTPRPFPADRMGLMMDFFTRPL